jgi:hypothetical protein
MPADLYMPAVDCDPAASPAPAEKETLQRAVAKIVALGAHVGISSGQMILLLHSGMTVSELLECLAGRSGDIV